MGDCMQEWLSNCPNTQHLGQGTEGSPRVSDVQREAQRLSRWKTTDGLPSLKIRGD